MGRGERKEPNLRPCWISWGQLKKLEPRLGHLLLEAQRIAPVLKRANSYNAMDAYDDLFKDRMEAMVGEGRIESETMGCRRTELPARVLPETDMISLTAEQVAEWREVLAFVQMPIEERIKASMSPEEQLLLTPEALGVAFDTIYGALMDTRGKKLY